MTPVSAPEVVVCAVVLLTRENEVAIRQQTAKREGFGQSTHRIPQRFDPEQAGLAEPYHTALRLSQPILKQPQSSLPWTFKAHRVLALLCIDGRHPIVSE